MANFSDNLLTKINSSTFSTAKYLKILDLSRNNISAIGRGAFQGKALQEIFILNLLLAQHRSRAVFTSNVVFHPLNKAKKFEVLYDLELNQSSLLFHNRGANKHLGTLNFSKCDVKQIRSGMNQLKFNLWENFQSLQIRHRSV